MSINTNNGLWTNFETGEKGNAMQLIAAQMGFSDFKDTIAYAKEFLNCSDFQTKTSEPLKKKAVEPITKESPNKKNYAEKLFKSSIPIQGTLAERYLKEYRKLSEFKEADLRFVPKISTWHGEKRTAVPALLCIGKTTQGQLNHVQIIRLNPLTGDKDYASTIKKQTYGSVNGCPIDLNKKSTSPITYLTEGVETGLSLLEGDKEAKVLVLCGKSNFKNIELSRLTNKVVLCVDNDGQETFKDSVIQKAVARLNEAGKSVSIMIPKHVGDDFNDVLIKEGVSEVKKFMENAAKASSFSNKIENTQDLLSKKPSEKSEFSTKLQDNATSLKKTGAIEAGQLASIKKVEIEHNQIKPIENQKKQEAIRAEQVNESRTIQKIKEEKILER